MASLKNNIPRSSPGPFLVVLIGVILGGFILASYSGLIGGNPHNKRVEQVDRDLQTLETGIAKFAMHAGRPPTEAEGLAALVVRPATLEPARDWVQVLKAIPSDPWKNAYTYRAAINGNHVITTIVSPSCDGTLKTEDDLETDPRDYLIQPR